MVSMSPVNYAGLALYFVVLGVSMVAAYLLQKSTRQRAASWLLIAITWFYILRFTITYPQTSWYQEGLNLFDVAYADVIWGGASGNWGYTQQLLCWAVVATVWTLEAPVCYQLFGLFGAMSGSFCLIDVERKPQEEVHLSLLLACLLAFGCIWMLPMSQSYREMSWWLWLLHACLILPKILQLGRKIPRGVVYLVLAALSFLTHRFSSRPRHWPSTDCQISITVDVVASSLLTLRFIHGRLGVGASALGALLTVLASPGAVLGLFCGFHDHRLRSWLVTSLQRFLAGHRAGAGVEAWMNLGYWKGATTYDDACKDLAELVGSEATLNANDAVLCVGCGSGAELAFFRRRFAPRRVAGLDAVAATEEVRRGAAKTMATGANHFRFNEFTKVLAVDCAYHFEKVKFFQEAHKVARETLTLTDVVLRNDAPLWLRMALCAMDIPWSNHWTEQEYRSKLHEAGFSIVSWRSLEPHVLASQRWPLLGRLAPQLDYVLIHAEVRKSDRPSAAVIGSGMSGLIAAHLLEETHEVVIYEAGPKCGLVGLQEQLAPNLAVDVPLRFMMPHYYRNLLEVIRELHIPTKAVPYNASYQSNNEMLLVTSTGWLGHILQHLKYVPYLARLMFTVFFREELPGESFLEYMQRFQLHRHEAYRIYSLHLSWMLSCTYEQANATPAQAVLGFIRASNPFLRMYQASGNILRIYPTMKALQDRLLTGKVIRVNSPVTSFETDEARNPGAGRSRCIDGTLYDVVLVATDAPAAGYLLGGEWQSRLSKIHYQKGRIIVHKDPRLMPARKEDWRTFNIREDGPKGTCQITVWLNKFWGRDDLTEDLFETWNPVEECKAELKVKDVELARATYTKEMHQLWSWIEEKQGEDGFYVAGAYALEGMSLLEQACVSAQRAVAAVHRDAENGRTEQLSDEHPSCRKKEN